MSEPQRILVVDDQQEILDLTETNPTRVGLAYPEGWTGALAAAGAEVHDPSPRGMEAARRALADY